MFQGNANALFATKHIHGQPVACAKLGHIQRSSRQTYPGQGGQIRDRQARVLGCDCSRLVVSTSPSVITQQSALDPPRCMDAIS